MRNNDKYGIYQEALIYVVAAWKVQLVLFHLQSVSFAPSVEQPYFMVQVEPNFDQILKVE